MDKHDDQAKTAVSNIIPLSSSTKLSSNGKAEQSNGCLQGFIRTLFFFLIFIFFVLLSLWIGGGERIKTMISGISQQDEITEQTAAFARRTSPQPEADSDQLLEDITVSAAREDILAEIGKKLSKETRQELQTARTVDQMETVAMAISRDYPDYKGVKTIANGVLREQLKDMIQSSRGTADYDSSLPRPTPHDVINEGEINLDSNVRIPKIDGQFYRYIFKAKANQHLNITVKEDVNASDHIGDTFIILYDYKFQALVDNDDNEESDYNILDPKIDFVVPSDGEYSVVVSSYGPVAKAVLKVAVIK